MLLILFTSLLITLLTYFIFKPLIDNLFNGVPHQPRYIHSYIPFIGFGLEMGKNPIEFIQSLYRKYGKTFTIFLTSKRWIYLFDEQTYLTKVLRSSDLSIDDFLNDINIRGLGVRRECLADETIRLSQLKQFHQYLVGEELEILNQRVHRSLLESMKFDAQRRSNGLKNFFDLFGEMMLFAGTDGLLGPSFAAEQRRLEPNFYRLFQDFDNAYKLGVIGMPLREIFYRDVFQNRREFIRRFSSVRNYSDQSKLIQMREELFRADEYKHLFREYDVAALQASILWAAVANTAPMCCWILIDLFLHPQALQAVQTEIDEHSSDDRPIYNRDFLSQLKILESCINETLRRILNVSSTRQAMSNTTIECVDKTKIGLKKGDMIIYPAFLKHFDPTLFGPNPYEYQYDRFVKKNQTNKTPSIMLFGCGTHICPGRYWAVNEIKVLAVLLLRHLNIEFPRMTDNDKEQFRKKLPHDYSKFVSSGGPTKETMEKFLIRYSYRNLPV